MKKASHKSILYPEWTHTDFYFMSTYNKLGNLVKKCFPLLVKSNEIDQMLKERKLEKAEMFFFLMHGKKPNLPKKVN